MSSILFSAIIILSEERKEVVLLIVWRGKGLLVVVSLLLGVLITTVFFRLVSIDPLDSSSKFWYVIQSLFNTILSAAINYFMTKKFVSEKVRVFIDEETGEKVQLKEGSHLFWIPNKYWTWIMLFSGIALTIVISRSL